MAKKNKLPIDLRVKDLVFFIEEKKDPESGIAFFDLQGNVITSLGLNDSEDPDKATELIINSKYNVPLVAKPGTKKVNEIITDPEEAMESLKALIDAQIEGEEKKVQKHLKNIETLKANFNVYKNRDLTEVMTNMPNPKASKSSVIEIEVTKISNED